MITGTGKSVEGYVEFEYAPLGKPMQTWYRVIGDLTAAKNPPLVCLHGGPGAVHTYLTPFQDLNSTYDIPVIFYDQAGNGRSTHVQEADASVLTESLFLAELDNLIARLGVEEYDLLGHSWGGMLAMRFAVQQPKGLRRLVVISSPMDVRLWCEAQNKLRTRLPQEVQDTLAQHEKAGTTGSEEYQAAVGEFWRRHLCRIDPFPQDVQAAFQSLEEDPTVYLTMYGPFQFDVIGTIKDWTITDELHKIAIPTLLINGRYDEAQDSTMAPAFAHIPKVRWVTLENSSHMSHWEERERVMEIVGGFLLLAF
ncbi:prolyl aminopeptidase-2 [Lactifluus subvellereus]|nr:prolyl aminopeptidase-2 [Lactifluus subvellereus]